MVDGEQLSYGHKITRWTPRAGDASTNQRRVGHCSGDVPRRGTMGQKTGIGPGPHLHSAPSAPHGPQSPEP
jgi:hypothetical protein